MAPVTDEGWKELADYVGASPAEDDKFVKACWAEAGEMIDEFVGKIEIPARAKTRARLEVGSELFHRRSAPSGVAQFAALDGAPIRVARDPMIGAYPILQRFVGMGIR